MKCREKYLWWEKADTINRREENGVRSLSSYSIRPTISSEAMSSSNLSESSSRKRRKKKKWNRRLEGGGFFKLVSRRRKSGWNRGRSEVDHSRQLKTSRQLWRRRLAKRRRQSRRIWRSETSLLGSCYQKLKQQRNGSLGISKTSASHHRWKFSLASKRRNSVEEVILLKRNWRLCRSCNNQSKKTICRYVGEATSAHLKREREAERAEKVGWRLQRSWPAERACYSRGWL